ncbi:hypothetical protein [Pseudolactococcus reticulitermitis]|uniref:hypothetical protein n=1 Tax=Pseudolactococcus reticulitermitis TaxID=2025039 RepID=UPI0012FF77EA|nr:hypothetical protein [Lactococcus reticulitermitis]
MEKPGHQLVGFSKAPQGTNGHAGDGGRVHQDDHCPEKRRKRCWWICGWALGQWST